MMSEPVICDRPLTGQERADLASLDLRIKAMLPAEYACYADVEPVSMGSASLKYGADGRVAWDEIWTTYCDLALAGGPPHRGVLLAPVSVEEVRASPREYELVVDEIARAVWLVTRLRVLPRLEPGWIGVVCTSEEMASWLVRAILVENVFARREGRVLHVPAGPRFRLDREIKNVVTALAKTHHYWTSHASTREREAASLEAVAPATPDEIEAAPDDYRAVSAAMGEALAKLDVGSCTVSCPGWIGVACRDVPMAIWLLRALLVDHVLARREERTLFLPLAPRYLAEGKVARLAESFAEALRLWRLHGRLEQHST